MDPIRPQARRPTIIGDIVLDGWAESARRVYRKLRNLQRMRLMVWIDLTAPAGPESRTRRLDL